MSVRMILDIGSSQYCNHTRRVTHIRASSSAHTNTGKSANFRQIQQFVFCRHFLHFVVVWDRNCTMVNIQFGLQHLTVFNDQTSLQRGYKVDRVSSRTLTLTQ